MQKMNRYFIICLLFISCAPLARIDYEKEKQQILALNAQQRENHFNRNARAITNLSSDSFLLVDGGIMSKPKKESMFKNFDSYFNAVDFIKWDDLKEPEVRFSKDATVAYVAVEKIVILKARGAVDPSAKDTSYFAWISIYKKGKSGWELDAIASTRKAKP
jgi:hypothetical protein